MSGGALDYKDSALTELQDMIAREIGYMEYGSNFHITVTNEDIEGIYPVITIITHEESEDDGGYPIMVASDLEEKEDGYFVWSHEDIVNFVKRK